MADVTCYFLARASIGPLNTCLEKKRFPRMLDYNFPNREDFLAYSHKYTILHDHGGESLIVEWTTDQECYDKYLSPLVTTENACSGLTLGETINKMGVLYAKQDNSSGCIHATEIFDSLGLTASQVAAYVPNVTWLELKTLKTKLDSGTPLQIYSDEEIESLGLSGDL